MKFTCTQENLIKALDSVSGLTGKQVNLPVLNNVLLKAAESGVELVATNLEIAIKVSLRARVEEQGEFTIPVKTLSDYVRLLDDEHVELYLEEGEVVVASGGSVTRIKGTSVDEFPVLPEPEKGKTYALLVEPFRQSLVKTVIAAARNEIRPELGGVYFGFFTEKYKGLVLAATDSYRLAEKKQVVTRGEETFECIVPARTISEIIRLLGMRNESEGESQVEIYYGETQMTVKQGSFELISRLVEGKYPDYRQIIPEKFKSTAKLDSSVLVKKIKAAGLFSTSGVNAVSFDFNISQKSLGVSSTSTQKGRHESSVDCEIEGEENSILLNHRYVLDGLAQIDGEVVFEMNSADSPCMLKEKEKEGYLYLIMPIRQ